PTPVVGGVGLIEDLSKISTLKGAQPGDVLILIGETKGHLGASLYAREILGLEGDAAGPPPPVDLDVEKRNADFVRSLIEQGLVNAVHDVSEGGIACAAAEMALATPYGLNLAVDEIHFDFDPDNDEHFRLKPNCVFDLFSEDQHRYLIALNDKALVSELTTQTSPSIEKVGVIRGSYEPENEPYICFYRDDDTNLFVLPLSKLRDAHEGWLPKYMASVD
ncbi:MAG: AIR synthase-related protein, partial [Pseudomonadota bacterium]